MGFAQFSVGPLGFGWFLDVVGRVEAWLDGGHLDGPLDDMISNEIDLAAAEVKNHAMSYRFKHGRENFDPPEFGGFLKTLEDFRLNLPVSQIALTYKSVLANFLNNSILFSAALPSPSQKICFSLRIYHLFHYQISDDCISRSLEIGLWKEGYARNGSSGAHMHLMVGMQPLLGIFWTIMMLEVPTSRLRRHC